jgi:hypothetical protein
MVRFKDFDLWSALVIILLTIYLSALAFTDKHVFDFYLGSLSFNHWLSWIGGLWIAFVTPIYFVLKKYRSKRIKALLRIHVFGNLVAFMLISIHFSFQITSVSRIGTGLALFIALLTLVVTGFLQRFNIMRSSKRYIKFLHVSMTTAFYLILIIHILGTLIIL